MARTRPTIDAPPDPAPRSPRPRAKKASAPASGESAARQAVLRQLLSVVGALGSAYALVSVATWSPLDASFSRAGDGPVRNAGGPLGAWLADLLLQVFGIGAWACAFVGLGFLMRLAGRPWGGPGRALALGALGWTALSGLGLVFPPDPARDYPIGGAVGLVSAELLSGTFGPAGAWIVLLGCSMTGLTLATRLDWGRVVAPAVSRMERGVPQMAGAGARLGRSALQGVVGAGSQLRERLRLPEPDDDDDLTRASEADEDDGPTRASGWDEPEGTAVLPVAPAPPPAAPRANRRRPAEPRLAPLPISIHDDPGLGDLPVPTALPVEVGSRVEPERTRFAARELVEVEWESTGLSAAMPRGAPPLAFDEDGYDIPGADAPPVARPLPPARGAAAAPVRGARPAPVWTPADPLDDGRDAPGAAPGGAAPAVPAAAVERPARAARRAPEPVDEDLDLELLPAARPAPAVADDELDDALDDEVPSDADEDDEHDEDDGLDEELAAPPRPDARPPRGEAVLHAATPEADEDLDHEPVSVPARGAPSRPAQHHQEPLVVARDARPRSGVARNVEVRPGVLESGGGSDDGIVIDQQDDTAFELPHLGLLDRHEKAVARFDEGELRALADVLEQKLEDFGVKGHVTAIRPGPVITTFEYLPAAGIKLSRITALEDDIAMALKALSVRIVAPIPGKGVVGFEVPNRKRLTVWMRDILSSDTFRTEERILPIALGKNVEGKVEINDLAKCPHLLVAGTTGSGKSVGVNAMLLSMLYTRSPDELRLILIDPKMLEFELYQDIPHLLHPVVTDPALANAALKWACDEMDARYRLLARWKTRNIESYNELVKKELLDWTPQKARRYAPKDWPAGEPPPAPRLLPYIVIVIDELADLMMVAAKDVEINIARIAQKARAAGIHLIVATQRPEKTVVTGIIKANLPSRIAFQVRSKLDGRIILDQGGAETLLGRGDMLFLPPGVAELMRCHGPFVSDDEVRNVCDFLRAQGAPVYEAKIELPKDDGEEEEEIEYDELYDLAVAYVAEQGKASTSMVQRQFKIGYNRAARIIEVMEKEGIVGPGDGAKPRDVLIGSHAAL